MAYQDVRLLGSALLLGRFTNGELARAAGVNLNTARSWVERNRQHLTRERGPSLGRGRPRAIWTIAPTATTDLSKKLKALDVERFSGELAGRTPVILERLENQYEAWRLATRLDTHTASSELQSLRRMVRISWEEFASFFSVSGELPNKALRTIAEIERDAGAGALPATEHLRDVAEWLAASLSRMRARETPADFSRFILRLRSDVRSRGDQVKVTAAALAGPVWSDEGLCERGASADDLADCPRIAELGALPRTLEEVSEVIGNGARGYCRDGEEAQAVLCGLTARRYFGGAAEVQRWLVYLRAANFWRADFAPVALHAVWEAPDLHERALLQMLGDDMRLALGRLPTRIGRLRRRPIEFATRMINLHSELTERIGLPNTFAQIASSSKFSAPEDPEHETGPWSARIGNTKEVELTALTIYAFKPQRHARTIQPMAESVP